MFFLIELILQKMNGRSNERQYKTNINNFNDSVFQNIRYSASKLFRKM